MFDNFFADDIFKDIGRNMLCPCGSGKKFKKCHLPDIESSIISNATAGHTAIKKLVHSSAGFPVYKCLIGKDWEKHGLANIVVARTQPNGRLVYGTFLVDLFCLGVKSAFCNADMQTQEFQEVFVPAHFCNAKPRVISLDFAKTVIYGAIAYARSLGFEPDQDFDMASCVLGGTDFKLDPKVKFGGPSGKPLYVIGPDDNSHLIIKKLERKLGKEGFEFVDPRV